MTPSLRASLYWIGISLDGSSFFLPAFVDFKGPVTGWTATGLPEVVAIILINGILRSTPSPIHFWDLASIFVVLWINPAFLMYAIASPFRPMSRDVSLCRVLIPAIIPFCWIIFHDQNYRPREGHFAWVLGMLLVLASGYSAKRY